MENERNQQPVENQSQPLPERNRETLYECQTMYTLELHRESISAISGNIRKNKIIIACLLPFMFLAGIFFRWFDFIFFGVFCTVFSVLMFLIIFALSPIMIKAGYKKSCELYGENRIIRHYFYDDFYVSATANANERHDYSKIGAVKESKNLCVLMLGSQKGMQRMGTPVSRHGFTKGDYESFKQFICWRAGLRIKIVK